MELAGWYKEHLASLKRGQIEPYVARWVLHIGESHDGTKDHRTELTEQRCFEIARANGYMTTEQVRVALLDGQRIYSTFSYFVLEA